MKIILEKVMQNGAQASNHTIERLTIQDGQAVAVITSRTSADQMAWQEPVLIDVAALVGDPLVSAAAALIGAGGYLKGGVIVSDPTPVETLRATMMSRVERLRDAAIHDGCETPSGRVDSDDASIRNILGSVQTASLAKMAGQLFSIDWRMADNEIVILDADEMIAMGVAVMAHVKGCYERSWTLKAAIEACQDEVSLVALDLTF